MRWDIRRQRWCAWRLRRIGRRHDPSQLLGGSNLEAPAWRFQPGGSRLFLVAGLPGLPGNLGSSLEAPAPRHQPGAVRRANSAPREG